MPVQREPSHDLVDDPPRAVPAVDRPDAPATGPARQVRTRTGAAWFGICVGALVLVALVVFMLQNTTPVDVTFLGMTGSAPLALVALIAGLGVGVVALVIGSLRITQLRRRLRRVGRLPATQRQHA